MLLVALCMLLRNPENQGPNNGDKAKYTLFCSCWLYKVHSDIFPCTGLMGSFDPKSSSPSGSALSFNAYYYVVRISLDCAALLLLSSIQIMLCNLMLLVCDLPHFNSSLRVGLLILNSTSCIRSQ